MGIKGVQGFTLLPQGASLVSKEDEEGCARKEGMGGRHHIRHLKLRVGGTIPR
jgi:hypothetical protein